jgi:hypothetical protein
MKTNLIALLFLFTYVKVNAQVPDTIYFEPFTFVDTEATTGVSDTSTDTTLTQTTYLVYEGKTLPNSGKQIITAIDKVMTAQEVVDYVFNIVYRNENLNWLDEARVKQRSKSNTLFPVVNTTIQQLASKNYFQYAREKFGNSYEGVYVVRQPTKSLEYFLVRPNGTVVQCDETGTIITGGKSGLMQIFTENRFRLNNYFGANYVFNKELDTNFFFSDVARVRKISNNLSQN